MSGKQITIAVGAKDQGASTTFHKVSVEISQIGKKSQEATSRLSKLVPSLSTIGKVGIGGIAAGAAGIAGLGYAAVRMIGDASQALDNLGAIQARTGLSAEGLSELSYAAKMSNVDVESLANAISTAQKNISQFVRTGGGRAAEALQTLGVRLTDANGGLRDINDLLPDLADGLNAIGDKGTKIELANRIFGGPEALQYLEQGSARLREFAAEARSLGVVFSQEQLNIADDYRDALDRISTAALGAKVQLMQELAPALTEIANNAARGLAALPEVVRNGIKAYREVISNSEAGQIIEDQVEEIFDRLGVIAKVGMVGVGRIVLAASVQAVGSITGIVFDKIEGDVDYRLKRIGIIMGAGIEASITRVFKGDEAADSMLAGVANALAMVERNAKPLSQSLAIYDANLNDSSLISAALRKSTEEMGATLRANVPAIWSNVDAILGITDAMAGAAAEATKLNQRMQSSAVVTFYDTEKPTEMARAWREFQSGATEAFDAAIEKGKKFHELGQSVVSTLTDGLSRDLAQGTLDAIKGAESLGDAFKNAGAKAVEALAEVAMQMVYIRLLTSAIGMFSGGGATAADAASMSVGDIVGTSVISGGAGKAFARGGIVPGVPQNRDTRIVAAASGEGFLTRRGVASVGGRRGVDAANRGQAMGGGDNVTITVSPTIVVQGTPNQATQQQLTKSVAAGVIEALRSNPRLRGEMRGALS